MPDLLGRAGGWCRDRFDIGLAVALTVASLAGEGLLARPDAWPASASVLGSAALLGWRRHRPVPLAIAVGALMAFPAFTRYASVINSTDNFGVAQVVTVFLFAYSLGADVPWRWSLLGLAPLTAGFALTAGEFNPLAEMLTVGPWPAGLGVASRRRAEARLEGRAHELEREREIFAIHSVRDERARIARELHDIVAHSVSLMVVQAGAGEHLARQDPARAAEAFDSITRRPGKRRSRSPDWWNCSIHSPRRYPRPASASSTSSCDGCGRRD